MGFKLVLYANLALRSSVKAVQNNLMHLYKTANPQVFLTA